MKCTFIDQATTEYQFISFCKSVLRNEVRNIRAEERRWNEKFISLDQLAEEQVDKLCTCDRYESESFIFYTHNHCVSIDDALIAEAVAYLPEKQKDVILLSFFVDLKDVEVAELINIKGSTLHYHKTKAFETLRKLIKEARTK